MLILLPPACYVTLSGVTTCLLAFFFEFYTWNYFLNFLLHLFLSGYSNCLNVVSQTFLFCDCLQWYLFSIAMDATIWLGGRFRDLLYSLMHYEIWFHACGRYSLSYLFLHGRATLFHHKYGDSSKYAYCLSLWDYGDFEHIIDNQTIGITN